MNFLTDNWGNLASVAGVLVSIAGLGWAIYIAWGARSAAEAARDATAHTRADVRRTLAASDVERAIALVERLKSLQRNSRWDVCVELYPSLRAMLSDIGSRYQGDIPDVNEFINDSVETLVAIEDHVARSSPAELALEDAQGMTEQLNQIQTNLQGIASSMQFQYSTSR